MALPVTILHNTSYAGSLLVSGSYDKNIIIWDTTEHSLKLKLQVSMVYVMLVVSSSDDIIPTVHTHAWVL